MHTEATGKNFNKCYVLSGSLQEQRVGMVNVHDIVDEGSHPPRARFLGEFGNPSKHKNREHQECVQHHSTNIIRAF